jgi:hypothetical protein
MKNEECKDKINNLKSNQILLIKKNSKEKK